MTADNPNPPDTEKDQPAEGNEIDDFLQRLPGSFRWPKPNAEAVAAAVEAIHRMSGTTAQDQAAGAADEPGNACSGCGGSLPAGARFCVWCGIPNQPVAGDASIQGRSGGAHHHFHHHYHHLVPSHVPSQGTASGVTSAESEPPLLAGVLPVRRALRPAAAPKPAPARLSRTGRRPATPGTLTICSNSMRPTQLSSAPAFRPFAACLRSGNFLSRCSKPDWATWRWNRCASKCWAR